MAYEDNLASAERIVWTREALGYAQIAFAKMLGFKTHSGLANIETARQRCTLNVALRLHQLFGIGEAWIFRGDIMAVPREYRDKIRKQMQINPHPVSRSGRQDEE